MNGQRLSGLRERLHRRGQLVSEPIPAHGGEVDPVTGDVRYDSRAVRPGDLFVARRGQHADGHDHVPSAVAAGAVAVIVERPIPGIRVPELVVRDARIALGIAAAWRAGDPSARLGIVGITGTDGKTTTAYLVRAILTGSGHATGLLGTTDVIVGGAGLGNPARTSTPEAPELQAHLARMLEAGDTWAVVESSSHGLAQHRVEGVAYDVAVLTNVTSEHLDFHGSLEAYRAAKRSLFARLAAGEANPDKGWGKHAVVNADDPQGGAAADVAGRAGAHVWRYGLDGSLAAPPPAGSRPRLDLAATACEDTPGGMRIDMQAGERVGDWQATVSLPLAGRFNVANALAAMLTAAALRLDLDAAADALAMVDGIPGRMQLIDEGQPYRVVVDYAHTADALAKVLDELRPADPAAGCIAVFGSAGERDTTKREPMGRVAGERCRLVIVTDEDPRGEDRQAILEAIARGAQAAGKRRGDDLLLIPDRADAIVAAIRSARAGDAVLLAGKGHEKTIESASGDIPWDEAAVAREAIRARLR